MSKVLKTTFREEVQHRPGKGTVNFGSDPKRSPDILSLFVEKPV